MPARLQAMSGVDAVARTLGPDFEVRSDTFGAAGLSAVTHLPTGIVLLLVPGGSFEMGLSARDEQAIASLRYVRRRPLRVLELFPIDRVQPLQHGGRPFT